MGKRGRALWILGAVEARKKSCPWSGGGKGQCGSMGDLEEGLVSSVRSLCLFQKALGNHRLSRRMATADWPH